MKDVLTDRATVTLSPDHRRSIWIVVALTLLALAVRVYRLDFFALRGDESFTVQFSSLPSDELFEGIRTVEPNPPLYYYALRGWMAAAGQGEYATRFFSVFFGVLAVPLIFALGRAMGGRSIGLVAAGIMTVNPFQIFHSQDVRNYTLWPALLIAAWWCLWQAIQRGRARDWAGYALLTLLGLYTHYYHAFVVLADNLFAGSLIVLRGWQPAGYAGARRRLLVTWALLQAAVGIGFLAWLAIGSTRAIEEIWSGASATLFEIMGRTAAAFSVGESVPGNLALLLTVPAAILVGVGAIAFSRRSPGGARMLLIGLAVPLMCVFVVSLARPLYRARYLNVTAPAFYLLAAQGIVALAAPPRLRVIGVSAATAWLVVAGYSHTQALFNPRFAKSPDWPARAAYFESNQQPGDVIVQNYPDPSLGHYYHGDAPLLIVPTGYLDEARRAETERTLQDLLNHYERIWLTPFISSAWDVDGTVERRLARSADRVWTGQIAGLDAQLYETPSVFASNIQRLDAAFEQGITLLGYRVAADRVQPGETLHLVLYWQADSPVGADYNVFTHLLDASSALRAQQDNAPVGGTYPTSQWMAGELVVDAYDIALPSDLPAGVYTIEVGLYDWITQVRLTTSQGEDHVILPVTIQVVN